MDRSSPVVESAGWLAPAAVAAVVLLLLALSLRQVSSPDVGFHLAAGSRILSGQGWPRTDPFTYTVPDHDYVDTSWGFQVALVLAQRAGGASGIVLFQAGLVLLLFFTLYCTSRLRPGNPGVLAALLLLGALAAEMRFEVRPELVSYILLAVVLHVLHRHAEGLRSPLAVLPVIFLVWANAHSLFVLGWGALACFVLESLLSRRPLDRRLLGWAAASVPVTLINPYGLKALVFPLTLATRLSAKNTFNQSIGEFVSPFDLNLSAQFPFYPRAPILAYFALLALALLSAWPLLRQRRWRCLLLVALFGWLSSSMIRNLPLLVVASLPGTLWGLSGEVLDRAPDRLRRRYRIGNAAAGLALVFALVTACRVWHDAYYVASRRSERTGLSWNRLALPIDAAGFARGRLEGPVLNHLNFGGYLIWARGQPVFIDGRLEVIGEEFFEEYRRTMESADGLDRAERLWGIRWIVFPYALAQGLLDRLSKDPEWALLHVDPLAVVFARAQDAGLAGDSAHAALPGAPTAAEVAALPGLGGPPRRGRLARWISGVTRTERFPAESFNLGLFHYFRGEAGAAAALFARGIGESSGTYYEMYQNLGAALYRLGRLTEAEACYRVVLADVPENVRARDRLQEIRQRLDRGR